eukprot:gene4312-5036_t
MSEGDEFEDWYSILQIEHDATDKQVQKAYRSLAVKYHPDKNKTKEAVVMFEKISKAQKALLDQDKRVLFDAQLKQKREKKRKEGEMDRQRKKMKDVKLRGNGGGSHHHARIIKTLVPELAEVHMNVISRHMIGTHEGQGMHE